jgi:hypothetical protein
MIALAADCLLFRLSSGECVPYSAEMVSVELMGDTARWFDEEFVKQATKAVFHYFKHELCRQAVTVEEFACALEKVLRGFAMDTSAGGAGVTAQGIAESDLCRLAHESGEGCELVFFPRLREELRHQLKQEPRVLRFRGLRDCVKTLVRARRWGFRCRNLEEQIVDYLRHCLHSETRRSELSLLIQ